MQRDIDYAAAAVRRAILERFPSETSDESLVVTAQDATILVEDRGMRAEGTRDELITRIRKVETLDKFWEGYPQRRVGNN